MISEDLVLGNILEEHIAHKKDIAVFDPGMKNRKTMVDLSTDDKYFVTRIYKLSKYEVAKGSKVTPLDFENDILKLTKHSRVYLYSNQKRPNSF